MRTSFCLIGITTLLIGLHLFSPKLVNTAVEPSQTNNIPSSQSFVASKVKGSQRLSLIANSSRDFEPPDNGGPDITRGSGTR